MSIKTDISAFFDNIERVKLKGEIRKKIKISSLHKMIDDVIDLEIVTDDLSSNKKIRDAGIFEGKGVRQGMPLSPLFANLYLTDLDFKIKQMGYWAIRYADDIIFFSLIEMKIVSKSIYS